VTRTRFVAIHGHFYQPPRENPWLERVEIQDSASPYHDWNARVTAECYAPNTASRRMDARDRIIDVVNNFGRVAFDVGPTLMAWLEHERPDVHDAIVEADRASRVARGHGNAIAQAYGHAILPLCSRRDKVTQVRWGLADFRHRFGREAEGMWLPEAAVSRETLEVVAEEGVRFTVLAPGQADAWREPGEEWRPAEGGLDPRRAYRYDAGEGRELALFFYDGPISHAIAFEGLLGSGDAMADRLLAGFASDPRPQLVHVATDGESYGHHHRFGDMALAAACARIEASGAAVLTNHAAFLAACPPAAEARVVEDSSWSCAHGVERWRADCGCRAGGNPGWSQAWRAPLREALDWLRDAVDALYEARAGTVLKDPWAARDAYVEVVLAPGPAVREAFLARHQLRPLGAAERVQAWKCLELQRHRLLMYTSCGWFFDEISGIETVQVLRYAARAVQLARELGADEGLEAGLVARLAAAPSNLPEPADGAGVWRRHVLPARADLRRVIAHYSMAAAHEGYGDRADVYAFALERRDLSREASGETSLAVSRVRATSRVTGETEEAEVAVLHFGGHDFHCALRAGTGEAAFHETRAALLRGFAEHGLAEVVRAVDRRFGGRSYGIRDVFLEERRRLLARVTESALAPLEATFERLYEDNRRLMQYLCEADAPAPAALAVAACHVLEARVARALGALAAGAPVPEEVERIRTLLGEARSLGVPLRLGPERVTAPLEAAVGRVVDGFAGRPAVAAGHLRMLLDIGRALGTAPDLWAAQNEALRLWRAAPRDARSTLTPLLAALGFASPPF
jgi:alpha-amylase/alpha-mannosidase (GH57 family)